MSGRVALSPTLAPPRPVPPLRSPRVPLDTRDRGTADADTRRAVGRVGVLGLAHFVNDAYSCVLPALLPLMLPALGLTVGAGGALTALYQVISAVVQPVVGHLSDRRRLRWPIWAGLALTGLGGSLVGLAPTFAVLAVLIVVASVGSALFHPVGAATVGRLAPASARGRWLGLYETTGWAGTVVGPLVIGLMVERTGPAGTWPVVLPGLLLALLLVRAAPGRSATSPARVAANAADRPSLRFLGGLTAIGSLRAWAYAAAGLFLPLLGVERGLGAGSAAHLLTVFFAAGAGGSLVSGVAADRLGAWRVVAGTLGATIALGPAVMLVEPSGPMLFGLAATAGFLLTGAYTSLTVASQQRLPNSAGMVTGLSVGLATGVGGLALFPLAALADDIGLRPALALALALGPLLGLVVLPPVARARSTRTDDSEAGAPAPTA